MNEEASGQIFFSIAFDFIGENKKGNKILKKGPIDKNSFIERKFSKRVPRQFLNSFLLKSLLSRK
ncbi:hypothetical protein B4065_2187 [Caldibacillus thermoamylovorans]|nr:hypothetical protein B4065_2187 [Caldibacillus thermoamylovorans]